MCERDEGFAQQFCCRLAPITPFFTSFNILVTSFALFSSIFALTILPLSLLLFSLSLSSHPIISRIHYLEALASVAPTRFEALQVKTESRECLLSLLRLKAFYFVPCCGLSLVAAVASVTSAAAACSGTRPTLWNAATAVRTTWRRPLATVICVCGLMLVCVHVQRTLEALLSTAALRLLAVVVGAALEVQLMAVASLGMVVSIVEDRVGFSAMWAGSCLMKGRRFSGWVLSGMFVLVTSRVHDELEGWMKGLDLSGGGWTVFLALRERMGLICLYGLVVLCSYVVTTVFYCDCKQRDVVIREGSVSEHETV